MSRLPSREPMDQPMDSAHHAVFPAVVEQYICPGCDAEIPLSHVVISGYGDKSRPSLVRRCRALCQHCRSGWDAAHVLESGVWRCSEIRRLLPRDVDRLRSTIDARLGVRQVA